MNWNRTQVLSMFNNKCHECGSTERLEIHHIIKQSVRIDNSLSNLLVLCRKCHEREESDPFRICNNVRIYNFNLPSELLNGFKHYAIEKKTTVTALITDAMKQYLKAIKK